MGARHMPFRCPMPPPSATVCGAKMKKIGSPFRKYFERDITSGFPRRITPFTAGVDRTLLLSGHHFHAHARRIRLPPPNRRSVHGGLCAAAVYGKSGSGHCQPPAGPARPEQDRRRLSQKIYKTAENTGGKVTAEVGIHIAILREELFKEKRAYMYKRFIYVQKRYMYRGHMVAKQ